MQLADSQRDHEKAVPPAGAQPKILLVSSLIMVGVIGVIDYLLGYDLSMAVFYVIPVAAVSWGIGKNLGILISAISAAAVYLTGELTRPPLIHPLYPVWKGIASLAILLLIAWLVAARKQEVERREKLMAQLRETAIVEERNRLAGEIHDTLAQGFTGISIQLEAAADILTASPEEARGHIELARKLARESLREARRSVWALRPPELEAQGLAASVVKFIERIAAGNSIRIEPSVQGSPQAMPSQIEMDLLRICQEATVNAIRHAEASKIQILLIYEPSKVELCVADNGRGFDPDAGKTDHGFGLTSMRDRAERIGAEFTIRSEPGRGTRVSATVPTPGRSAEESPP